MKNIKFEPLFFAEVWEPRSVFLLDPDGHPVPDGDTGEIYFGDCLAAGYLNQPELTAAAFPAIRGKRLYKTGDLARRTNSGDLEFLGRADRQVTQDALQLGKKQFRSGM